MLVVLAVVVLVLSTPWWHARSPESSGTVATSEIADLEAARDAKYREIRDAELDHRTGKLSDEDYGAVSAALRAEAIEIMRALWTEPAVDYAGRFYTLSDARLAPKPGPIPIWFGGFSDQLLSAVVRYGDGWILGTNPDPAFVAERWDRLRELCRAAGRDPSEIRVAVPLMAHLSMDRERARASIEGYIARGDFSRRLGDFFGENARAFGLWGTPADALPKLAPHLDLGVRDFIFDLRPPSIALETAELLAAEIVPRLASL